MNILHIINLMHPVTLAILSYNIFILFNSIYNNNLIIYRIIRNIFTSNLIDDLLPYYNNCSYELLVEKLTVVISAKDTCSQGVSVLLHLLSVLPKNISIFYVYPDFIGCNLIDLNLDLFDNLIIKKIPSYSSPIKGFLDVQNLIKTQYTLLMHNDVYAMDYNSFCELYRGLEKNTNASFSVPQIYERSENKILSTHGHFNNLHLKLYKDNYKLHYDVDFDLVTKRKKTDFKISGYPQMDFMEDHVYMTKTNIYHLYLDEDASFTMEQFDSVMSLRVNNTYPWYVPTSRFIFDVNIDKLAWYDIPYFVNKRSEETCINVINYLTSKWGIIFPNTGIWNYIKYSFLHKITLYSFNLPNNRLYQAALYYSWFHSIGFNRYNNFTFNDICNNIEVSKIDNIEISRIININNNLKFNISSNKNKNIFNILPINNKRQLININLNTDYIPLAYTMNNNCDESKCGMLLIDNNICYCFTYHPPYNIHYDYGISNILDYIKIPSRITKFIQMKYFIKNYNKLEKNFYFCNSNQEKCNFMIPAFTKYTRLIKWSWFAD